MKTKLVTTLTELEGAVSNRHDPSPSERLLLAMLDDAGGDRELIQYLWVRDPVAKRTFGTSDELGDYLSAIASGVGAVPRRPAL